MNSIRYHELKKSVRQNWIDRRAVLLTGAAVMGLLASCGGVPSDADVDTQMEAVLTDSITITDPAATNAITGPHSIVVTGTVTGSGISSVGVKTCAACAYVAGTITGYTFPATVTNATYTVTLPAMAAGSYLLTAKVIDPSGTNWSLDVPLTVESGMPAPLHTYRVTTLAALKTRLQSAVAGDYIVVAKGTYTVASTADLAITRSGTAASPVVVTSEYAQGATIAGTNGFRLTSVNYVWVRGFNFTHDTAVVGYSNAGMLLDNTSYCHVARNFFHLNDSHTTASQVWLFMNSGPASGNNVIDHNTFENKNTYGQYVALDGYGSTYISSNDSFTYNFFHADNYNRALNGGQCMRLGDSPWMHLPTYMKIRYNRFDNCNGSSETISLKASSYTVQGNTFINNASTLSLRQGDNSLVDGNYLINNHDGIIMYGNNHTIINNVIQGSQYFGILVGDGTVRNDTTPNGTSSDWYDAVDNAKIAFNTLENNNYSIQIGYDHVNSPYPPQTVTIGNNVVASNNATHELTRLDSGTGITWDGNWLWNNGNASVLRGIAPTYTWRDPVLAADGNGVMSAQSTSAIIGMAANKANYSSYVTTDDDGQARGTTYDVGSDQWCNGCAKAHPFLTASAVGPYAAPF